MRGTSLKETLVLLLPFLIRTIGRSLIMFTKSLQENSIHYDATNTASQGHGTAVATLAAGATDNTRGKVLLDTTALWLFTE